MSVDNRFVVKTDNEKILCFYYEKGNIITREIGDKSGDSKKIIAKGVRENYTVNLCKSGEIYLFCQAISGDILHLRGRGEDWSENVILKNNGKSSENIIFYCLENGGKMSLVYNIPVGGKNSYDIMKQSFDGKGSWSSPEKIDTVVGMNDFVFKVITIDFGYGIVFYQKSTGGSENNIGYREFNINSIGNYNSVYSTNYRIGAVSFLPMNSGVHFIFAVKNIFSSRIIYRRKDSDGMNDYIILGEAQQIESCELFYIKEKIYALWKTGMGIFYCVSEDNGKTFSKPVKFKGKVSPSLKKADYLDFSKKADKEFFATGLYTNKNNPYDIEILSEFYDGFVNMNKITPKKEMEPAEVAVNNVEEKTVRNEEYVSENIVERLKNQVYMLNSQIAFKDKQIEQLTASVQRKNEEIVMTDRSWREKYKRAVEENVKAKKMAVKETTETTEEIMMETVKETTKAELENHSHKE